MGGKKTAAALATEFRIPFHGSNWQHVADESGAEACVVTVAHEMTEQISSEVIEKRLHVLAEKPVALSSHAVLRLARACEPK